MLRRALATALLFSLWASGAHADPAFRVRVSPVANLVYHLDCLSGYRRCTSEAFRDLWDRLGDDESLERQLTAWRNLQERYRVFAEFAGGADSTPYPYTYPYLQARGVDVAEKLRLASLQASDFDDYAGRLRLLMQPTDARAAIDIVDALMPRFLPWWTDTAAPELERLAAGYGEAAGGANLALLLRRVGQLFEVENDQITALDVDLIALPDGARASRATVIENHAIVETRRGEAPADRLGVIVHEFVHYLYALSPPEAHAAMLQSFLASGRPYALRAYNLFNEAIASAIGNGILERRLQSERDFERYRALPDSFYANFYVDTLAKALVPVLNRWLATGRPLDSGFAIDYLDAANEALGGRLDDVELQLASTAIVAGSQSLAEVAELPASAITTFSLFTQVRSAPELAGTALERYPELSGMLLVLSEDLPQLNGIVGPGDLDLLGQLAAREDAFVFALPRSPRATLYLVVGRDARDVRRALSHLLSLSRVFTGVSLPSPRSD